MSRKSRSLAKVRERWLEFHLLYDIMDMDLQNFSQ